MRQPDPSAYFVGGGVLHFATQTADLNVDNNTASVLLRDLPPGDVVVETGLGLNVPDDGNVYNYVQAGLVFYRDDDNYLKLTETSIRETRQTEYGKELKPVPAGYPRYGNSVAGTPGKDTYLRIVRRLWNSLELYTAYTSQDGTHWVHGGTWDHQLGSQARLGLVAMGGSGFVAQFKYVRISRPFLSTPLAATPRIAP